MTTLADFLDDIEAFYRRYVVFPSEHESTAVALWTAHAWLVDRFDVSPILAVTSAEMRSGKTRVLDCAELLVPNPRRMVLPSEAVFYTVVAQRPRTTILLDEVDAIFGPRPRADRGHPGRAQQWQPAGHPGPAGQLEGPHSRSGGARRVRAQDRRRHR